jgi:hypothetical protein
LVVGFGTHSADNNVASVVQSGNGVTVVKAQYTLADLSDTFAATNVNPQDHRIPRGSIVTRCMIHTIVTPTGSNATLDLGMWGVGLATEVVDDADGLVAAASLTELDQIGSAILCDGAYIVDGPSAASTQYAVGSISDSDCVLAPSYETAAFTAGVIEVTLEYIAPGYDATDPLLAINT